MNHRPHAQAPSSRLLGWRAPSAARAPATRSKLCGSTPSGAHLANASCLTPPRAPLTHITARHVLRKRSCLRRYSAPCVETAAWLSDDTSPAFERPQSSSLPEPLAPMVSLSPALHRGVGVPAPRAAAAHSTIRDGAQPSVRWSCPALVMGAERAAVDSRLLRAGGFCSQAPLKRLHEQAFDTSALLRMSA